MATFKDARDVAASIVRTLNPVSITLFGSVAREGSGADLDLLIVTDEGSAKEGDVGLLLHRCLKRFSKRFAIDPFIIPSSVLKEYYLKGSPFLKLVFKEGRTLYMKGAVQEWLRQSEDELNMAKYLLQGGFFKGACYHAQQSIEKAIQARLLKKGWELEKTHNIERLTAICRDYRMRLTLTDEEIVFMDNIYRGRYPAEAGLLPLGEPKESDAKKAVNIAERMFKNAQASMNKMSH